MKHQLTNSIINEIPPSTIQALAISAQQLQKVIYGLSTFFKTDPAILFGIMYISQLNVDSINGKTELLLRSKRKKSTYQLLLRFDAETMEKILPFLAGELHFNALPAEIRNLPLSNDRMIIQRSTHTLKKYLTKTPTLSQVVYLLGINPFLDYSPALIDTSVSSKIGDITSDYLDIDLLDEGRSRGFSFSVTDRDSEASY